MLQRLQSCLGMPTANKEKTRHLHPCSVLTVFSVTAINQPVIPATRQSSQPQNTNDTYILVKTRPLTCPNRIQGSASQCASNDRQGQHLTGTWQGAVLNDGCSTAASGCCCGAATQAWMYSCGRGISASTIPHQPSCATSCLSWSHQVGWPGLDMSLALRCTPCGTQSTTKPSQATRYVSSAPSTCVDSEDVPRCWLIHLVLSSLPLVLSLKLAPPKRMSLVPCPFLRAAHMLPTIGHCVDMLLAQLCTRFQQNVMSTSEEYSIANFQGQKIRRDTAMEGCHSKGTAALQRTWCTTCRLRSVQRMACKL
jgi:hypothetical protein